MIFSSPVFLFLFLPLVIAGGLLLKKTAGNVFLLVASLIFYAWGEGSYVLLLLASITLNYFAGMGIDRYRRHSRLLLALGVVLNILLLFYFKYFNALLFSLGLSGWLRLNPETAFIFPLGISFFTFQGISYLADIALQKIPPQKNPLHFSLYIAFFPQLISGPINRYPDIAPQLKNRTIRREKITEGLIRFIRGLAKKLIIANTLGLIADSVFSAPSPELSALLAWTGILCYTLQIYYDFSAYSDMAIGLARVFGFEYKENFNYPYAARSVQEFWQRWHISLSSWLRDYLFTPLSVKWRNAGSFGMIAAAILTFSICGIWHNPGWNFLIWGLIHALLLILERIRFLKFNRIPALLRRMYVIFFVMVSWVFFRAEDPATALLYLESMLGLGDGSYTTPFFYFNGFTLSVLIIAIVFAFPLRQKIATLVYARLSPWLSKLWTLGRYPAYLLLFLLGLAELAQSGFNPFIYFRF